MSLGHKRALNRPKRVTVLSSTKSSESLTAVFLLQEIQIYLVNKKLLPNPQSPH